MTSTAGNPSLPLAAGSVIAGRYRIDRPLAKGGMGCVWIGHHLQLDIGVAVKLMTPEMAASADARARFEREAKASAQLRIPNAVHVYDFGVEGDAPFIVMELLEGEDLEARLAREKRLSPAATWPLLEQICRGLGRAHEVGLVHRDLKPANVFLSRRGNEETVKILDFGIAKDVRSSASAGAGATKTGMLMGSPHYMSPEQVRSTNKVDLRSDLWAAGVIAFRCLTGQLPFPGEEVGEVLVDVCTKPVPVATEVAPWLRAPGTDVDRFFAKALARDPAARFQSAAELASAFTALVFGAASTAPMVSGAASSGVANSGVANSGAANSGGAPGGLAPGGVAPQATVLGPAPVSAAPPVATLAPSSQTWNAAAPAAPPKGLLGALLAVTGAAVALGIAAAAFFLLFRGRADAPVPPSPGALPVPTATATAPAPSSTNDAPISPSTSAPSASVSGSSAPSASPSAKPGKSPPAQNRTPGKKPDDLLNHI